MNKIRLETSIYLDLVRLGAVTLVLLDHLKRDTFIEGFLMPIAVYGQEAVAIFFVLSGLVISNATICHKQRFGDYIIARLARLWSVVIPAVALTVVLDVVGAQLAPDIYASTWASWHLNLRSLWQALSPILFLNSISPFNVDVGSNGPFWSLSYEAWYYLAFGLAVYLTGWARFVVLAVVVRFVGSGICMLAPLWIIGVSINAGIGRGLPSLAAWVGWLGSLTAIGLVFALKYKLIIVLARAVPLEMAREFVEKYLVALLIGANILFFDLIGPRFGRPARLIATPVRALVGRSFSMYLYQAPVLFFIAALAQKVTSRPLRIGMFVGGAMCFVALIAEFTERRKLTLSRWLSQSARQRLRDQHRTQGGGGKC